MSTQPSAPDILRIGVIGTGRIGRMHADYIARHTPRATLSAVSDVNAHSAAEVGAIDLIFGVHEN